MTRHMPDFSLAERLITSKICHLRQKPTAIGGANPATLGGPGLIQSSQQEIDGIVHDSRLFRLQVSQGLGEGFDFKSQLGSRGWRLCTNSSSPRPGHSEGQRQSCKGDHSAHLHHSPLCWISFAARPVQPVWWLAPTPEPLSPWKYS